MEEPRRLGGRYELGQVLGRGGMAEVYLAHDTRLGRTVAVKTLRADMARDPSFQARFRREAQSAASLNHPAIVAVYDTGEDYIDSVSIPYIVMEYVDGSTLRELLHSGRKLLPERTLEMCTGILQALEYSHRSGIVHRDIKPANVMLTRTGQVKVMDFGIARAMGDSGMTMTQTAAVIGTAQYLSPEQAKGEQVDARSDLYSTGCLLYELLTGRPPFVGDSPVAVAYQHVREEAPPPSTFDPEVTPEMDAIVMKALVKDPDYRYQSADEMRADIDAALEGLPVAAAAAMGAVGYGGDNPTTAMAPQNGYGTSMLPPARDDDGGMGYDDRGQGRRRQQKRSGATSTVLLILAGILVLVGAIFIGKSIFGDQGADPVTVPNVVGEKFADAQNSMSNVKLTLTKSGEERCDEPEGTVCSTSPAAGEDVDRGSTVTAVVSKGSRTQQVTVPDVEGFDADEAEDTLREADFDVEREEQESSEPEGQVLSQDPAGDTRAPKGATVTLTVAVAPEETEPATINIPRVIDLSYEDAKSTLEGQGFVVSRTDQETADAAPETVIAQSPEGGTAATEGDTVTVTVAVEPDEPAAVTVPSDLVNKTVGEAKAQLEGMGLVVGFIPGAPSDDAAIVMAHDPPAGTEVEPGSTVNLVTRPGDGE
ncbi:Stk1 family PASTA domain-containing Ser/Thr kinase [Streptomyces sp. NBC_01808]|uniref:Stk1 family PASTA domain-containing Ser/Thr kinase n=1 Tax=Streptomyces sp. NBC_01808 TaxID=2975947 RepID=UPI002DDB6775|nr:Stk1 family PASTA domain-containing Ser/Thr kinase [Streptomyces sp. NBC_01808]WSA39077.1 Stk1 family PASTA domain-containing Ser/Thr kinase [Streptomyces sp. NBC_01808]